MTSPIFGTLVGDDERDILNRAYAQYLRQSPRMQVLDAYYEGEQRLQHIGLAVPPELQIFETVVNIPRMAVDEPTNRQKLRNFYRTGSAESDTGLREGWEFNNLDSRSRFQQTDSKIFGRSFVSVSPPEDGELPRIMVEDPRSCVVEIDQRSNRIVMFARFWRDTQDNNRLHANLKMPYRTTEFVRGRNGWEVVERWEHDLGAVPVVMFPNRPRTSNLMGTSEMKDVIGKTDSIARMLTLITVGAESIALPHLWIFGADEESFVDDKGKPVPVWESYITAIKAITNEKGSLQQAVPADLTKFTETVDSMLAWCAVELGLPTRYAGIQSVNPAAEGAIRADESRLVLNVENKNLLDGSCWSWTMALYEFMRDGREIDNTIRARWHDPATPTYSQRADGVTKMYAGGIMSREGVWDEMGWDEPRKDLEKARLESEARSARGAAPDGGLAALMAKSVNTPDDANNPDLAE